MTRGEAGEPSRQHPLRGAGDAATRLAHPFEDRGIDSDDRALAGGSARRVSFPDGASGGGEQWVIAANRGPVEYSIGPDGQRVARRGSGGLVTALRGVTPYLGNSVFVCAARTDEDREVAHRHPAGIAVADERSSGATQLVRFLDIPAERFHQYYSVISNPLIWFVQHNLWDVSNAPNLTATERLSFDEGYRVVNQTFADAVVNTMELGRPSFAMIHDYHLYLVGAMVRRARPDVVLSHFIHVPWPQPEAWRVLPRWFRDQLFAGIVGNDLVNFQTERDAQNFLLTCGELMELPVDMAAREVDVDGRRVAVRWHPISVDAEQLEAQAESPEVQSSELALENARREHLILRVDRTDLSKNILRGFLAFDRLLEMHPDLAGRITFLALLQPSRQDVAEYAEYTERIMRLVADINLKHGNVEWQPIDLRMEDNLVQSLAAFKLFDVLLVNPVNDGLNLVAKEGMLLNRRNGVLVLSEHAGAHAELGAHALSVHPIDVEQQAVALHRALFMPVRERQERHDACVRVIKENGLGEWLSVQVDELRSVGLRQLAVSGGSAGAGIAPHTP